MWVDSAVPKVGAPVRIEIAPTKLPMMTGVPGRTICASAMPASVSASTSVMQPTAVTGPIAPASTAGTTSTPWLRLAYTRRLPDMFESKVSGEFELTLPISTGCVSRKPSPKTRSAIRQASAALTGFSGVPSQGMSQ